MTFKKIYVLADKMRIYPNNMFSILLYNDKINNPGLGKRYYIQSDNSIDRF